MYVCAQPGTNGQESKPQSSPQEGTSVPMEGILQQFHFTQSTLLDLDHRVKTLNHITRLLVSPAQRASGR